jgi:transposase-like protein
LIGGAFCIIIFQIIPEIKEWQARPIEKCYPILYLDALHYQ